MLIWSAFLTNAAFESDACVRRWLQLCSQQPREPKLLQEMEDILRRGEVKSHPLLGAVHAKVGKCEHKAGVAGVAVIDCVVQQCLEADEDKLNEWNRRVMAGWYTSREGCSEVLKRLNDFMQDSIQSIRVPVA